MRALRLTLPFLVAAGPALAEAPTVLADTAPVHSLVALVMGDLGSPGLLVPPGTSPHEAGLRPSDAGALAEADLIVWTGPALLPWLEDAIGSLAPEARSLALLDAEGWTPLPARGGAHLHGGGEAGHEEEAGHEGEAGHEDEAVDPHAWLDPAVAAAWLPAIALALAAEDPANAEAYRANAAAAARRLEALGADVAARLRPLAGRGYAVGHDAYQYFERAAGLPAALAATGADGAPPAPGDLADLRDAVRAGEVGCLLLDAESDPALAEVLGEGTPLRTATVDPDGVLLEPGPDLYPALVAALAAALEECLG